MSGGVFLYRFHFDGLQILSPLGRFLKLCREYWRLRRAIAYLSAIPLQPSKGRFASAPDAYTRGDICDLQENAR
jgi:hypothetical protein